MHVLITGGADVIGSHLVDSLLADDHEVTVFDNFDPFYDRAIKEAHIQSQRDQAAWRLIEGDLLDLAGLGSGASQDWLPSAQRSELIHQ